MNFTRAQVSMIQWDLQIVMMQIGGHLWIETTGDQASGSDLEKRLLLMPAVGSTAEYDGQEQYDSNIGKSFLQEPADEYLHMVRRKRRLQEDCKCCLQRIVVKG